MIGASCQNCLKFLFIFMINKQDYSGQTQNSKVCKEKKYLLLNSDKLVPLI